MGANRRLWSGINVYLAGLDVAEPIPTTGMSDETKTKARSIETHLELFQKKHSNLHRTRKIIG